MSIPQKEVKNMTPDTVYSRGRDTWTLIDDYSYSYPTKYSVFDGRRICQKVA